MTENAVVIFDDTEAVSVESRAVPEPDPNEVLIRTDRTLVSTGTELTVLAGDVPPESAWDDVVEFPFVPGYNNVGTIVEVGNEVHGRAVGERVATYGGHAAFVTVDAGACRPIPDGVSDDEAAFFTIAEIVMNGVRRGQVTWGEAVVVYGLGLLGQLAVRVCHFAGARPVVGVDLADQRLSHLPSEPAVEGVNPRLDDVAPLVRQRNDDRLADVVFEVTGNPAVIPEEFASLREQGRFVVLSSPRGETAFDFHDYCNAPSHLIIGAHNGSHPPVETPATPWTQHRHAELFFDLVNRGEIAMDGLVTHRKSVDAAPELYRELLDDRSEALGVLFEW